MNLDWSSNPDDRIKDFGTIIRGRSFWGNALAPSVQGESWSLYVLYRDHIVRRGRWSVHEVNLSTETVTAHYGVNEEAQQIFAFPDGRIYVPAGEALHRLNAKTGGFDRVDLPCNDYWFWRPGEENHVFLGGSAHRRIVRLNLTTDEIDDLGPLGHAQGRIVARMGDYGSVTAQREVLLPLAVDRRAVYLVTGQLPRALWAMDLRTRSRRVLMCVVDSDQLGLAQRSEGCFAVLQRRDSRQVYRLDADAATLVDELPDRPDEPLPLRAGQPPPRFPEEIPFACKDYASHGMCQADGTATVHYQARGGPWRSVRFELGDYPSHLFRLSALSNGSILGSSHDPYTIFQIDTAAQQVKILGASPYYTHVYGFAGAGGKIFFTGYTGAPIFEYDPDKPWTYRPPMPEEAAPLPEDESSNPRLVGRVPLMRRAYDILLGYDGRLYMPCSAEMTGPLASGGGLGWYDPATRRTGLIRDGFEYHSAYGAVAVNGGRCIAAVTTPWWSSDVPLNTLGMSDRVVIHDVHAGRIIADAAPFPDACGEGTMLEWRPNKILGRFRLKTDPPETGFFVMDACSGHIESTFRLPGTFACRMLPQSHDGALVVHDQAIHLLQPDRRILTRVESLPHTPQDWCLAGRDVYTLLGPRLLRLRIG